MSGTITHEWNGTTLIITSDSGTSSCDLKGEQGDMGVRGAQGPQGEPYNGLSFYPIGAIYVSTTATSPAQYFGGTWERLKDRFLLGAGDSYNAGATGGSATVTLTKEQLPEHSHSVSTHLLATNVSAWNLPQISQDEGGKYTSVIPATHSYYERRADDMGRLTAIDVGLETRGGSHNNMPPYLTVYMWKRVA